MDKTLLDPLFKAGLTEKETRVYLALLELGDGQVTEIAARAELKRSIVYIVLDDLLKRGFISETPGKKVRQFTATDPSKLIQHAQANLEDLKLALPVLNALQKHGTGKPKIEIFEGKEGISKVFYSFYYASTARYFSNTARLAALFPNEVRGWIEGVQKGKIGNQGQKILETDTPEGRAYAAKIQKRAGHEVRFIPKELSTEMDFGIVDDKLAITSFDPLYIVVIHSPAIARSAAVLFDLAWKQGLSLKSRT